MKFDFTPPRRLTLTEKIVWSFWMWRASWSAQQKWIKSIWMKNSTVSSLKTTDYDVTITLGSPEYRIMVSANRKTNRINLREEVKS